MQLCHTGRVACTPPPPPPSATLPMFTSSTRGDVPCCVPRVPHVPCILHGFVQGFDAQDTPSPWEHDKKDRHPCRLSVQEGARKTFCLKPGRLASGVSKDDAFRFPTAAVYILQMLDRPLSARELVKLCLGNNLRPGLVESKSQSPHLTLSSSVIRRCVDMDNVKEWRLAQALHDKNKLKKLRKKGRTLAGRQGNRHDMCREKWFIRHPGKTREESRFSLLLQTAPRVKMHPDYMVLEHHIQSEIQSLLPSENDTRTPPTLHSIERGAFRPVIPRSSRRKIVSPRRKRNRESNKGTRPIRLSEPDPHSYKWDKWNNSDSVLSIPPTPPATQSNFMAGLAATPTPSLERVIDMKWRLQALGTDKWDPEGIGFLPYPAMH